MDINGSLHVLGESRTRRAVPDPALAPAIMDFMTENHLTAALPNSRLPNPATITVGWEVATWCKANGVIRYANNTIAYTVSTPGLVFARCLDTSSLTGYWQFWNVTELGANAAFDYRQAVIDILNVPPGAPANGDRYIVGTAPVGLWIGQANSIAQWDAILMQWIFDVPVKGWLTIDMAAGPAFYYFDGFNWIPFPVGPGLVTANNGLFVSGTTVKLGGPLLQNTNINGGLVFELDFVNLKSFDVTCQDFFELVVLGVNKPRVFGDGATNFLSFVTGGSAGVAGDVVQSDGLGHAIWGPPPAFPGLTSAINGLHTTVSTVKLGGPLIENTTVTATGFQLKFGDNFAVLLGFGPQDIALSTTQGLWLNSDLPIHVRTNGSSGAVTNLITHNGLGAVWDSLANIIFAANPFTATYPLQWDTPLNVRVIPSATMWDVLTTNAGGLVVWSSFTANPVFNSTVNTLINTYINSPTFFTSITNNVFKTNLNTYLNTQVNTFNVNILVPGNPFDILTTQGTTATWVTPPIAVPLVSITSFITITAGPVVRTFDIFAHAGAANMFIMSTAADTYSWVTGAALIAASMSATNVGVGGAGVLAPFVETYETGSLATMRFRRVFAFNYGIELQYAGINPTQSIIIKNGIAPALPPSGPGDKILKWNSITTLFEWGSAAALVCADNGLSVNGITGCVELGGTVYKDTVVNSLYKGLDWTNFQFVRYTNFTAPTFFKFFSVSSPLALSRYHNLEMSPLQTFLELSATYSLVTRQYSYMQQQLGGGVNTETSFRFFATDDKNNAINKFGNAGVVDIIAGLCINFTGRDPIGNNIFVDPTYNTTSAVVSQRETLVIRSVSCTLPTGVGSRVQIGQVHIVKNLGMGAIVVTAGVVPQVIGSMKTAIFVCVDITGPGVWTVLGPF